MCVCVCVCVCVGNPRASQQIYPLVVCVFVCILEDIHVHLTCGTRKRHLCLLNGAVYYTRHRVERWWKHQLCSRLLAYFHVVQFAGSVSQHPRVE